MSELSQRASCGEGRFVVALKGEAKRDYQRKYMKGKRSRVTRNMSDTPVPEDVPAYHPDKRIRLSRDCTISFREFQYAINNQDRPFTLVKDNPKHIKELLLKHYDKLTLYDKPTGEELDKYP